MKFLFTKSLDLGYVENTLCRPFYSEKKFCSKMLIVYLLEKRPY